MSCADDLRVLRDALDMVLMGGLPSWRPMTTALGREVTVLASTLSARHFAASMAELGARGEADKLRAEVESLRAANSILTDRVLELESERHEWFVIHSTVACRRCGVVRRADGGNKPCPGTTPRIATREKDGQHER